MNARWVGVSLCLVVGCATAESARQDRRDKIKLAERLFARVPIGTADGVELRFQTAELKVLEAEDLEQTGDTEAADQRRYEAGRLLDELLSQAPTAPRISEIAVSRANVAVLRKRHDDAVRLIRRALELGGHSEENLRFLQASLPRQLRLSGDCPGALALAIPGGVAGQATHLERATCLRDAPDKACDELLAALGDDVGTPDPHLLHAIRPELNSLASTTMCLARFPANVRAALAPPSADGGS